MNRQNQPPQLRKDLLAKFLRQQLKTPPPTDMNERNNHRRTFTASSSGISTSYTRGVSSSRPGSGSGVLPGVGFVLVESEWGVPIVLPRPISKHLETPGGGCLRTRKELLHFRSLLRISPGSLSAPPNTDGWRGISSITLYTIRHEIKAWRRITFEFGHVRVVRLDDSALNILNIWRRRFFINNVMQGAFQVGGLSFVKKVDVEAAAELDELAVDVLESLIVGFESIDELG